MKFRKHQAYNGIIYVVAVALYQDHSCAFAYLIGVPKRDFYWTRHGAGSSIWSSVPSGVLRFFFQKLPARSVNSMPNPIRIVSTHDEYTGRKISNLSFFVILKYNTIQTDFSLIYDWNTSEFNRRLRSRSDFSVIHIVGCKFIFPFMDKYWNNNILILIQV